MWSAVFWKQAAERCVKTFAQTLVALLGAGGAGIINAPWLDALSVAGMAALLSVLTSIASSTVAAADSPSLVEVTPAAEPAPAT